MVSISRAKTMSDTIFAAGLTRKAPNPLSRADRLMKSPRYGNIIRDCARESALYERELWAERERTSEDRVRGAGCVVTELDAREKERFREAAAPMYEKYCSEYVDIIDDIMDAGRQ